MEEAWAAADSLLGMIQRGRGAAYPAALAQPRQARDFLIDCIADDPRWDHQVESRGWLYACLVKELGVDLRWLRAAYSRPADPGGDADAWLAIDVLEDLARAQVEGSVTELRYYLRTGRDLDLALRALVPFHAHPEARGLLDELLEVADDEQLGRAVAWSFDLGAPPWPQWRAQSPRVDRVLWAEEQRVAQRRPVPHVDRSAAERERILDAAVERGLLSPGEATGLDDSRWEATLLRVAPQLLADRSLPAAARIATRRQMMRQHSPDALAWARSKAGLDGTLGHQALAMLSASGEAPDAAELLDHLAISSEGGQDSIAVQCTLVDGLTRLAYRPAAPIFESLFDTTVYSYLRERCALGLGCISGDFARGRAVECLTDAEAGTRGVGVTHADLSMPDVRERLVRMAEDAMEEEGNRRAASIRISLERCW
ncbi:hypothetical protein D7D52_12390 [Nocardia yunnanensis]|uniref:HEAT repeat domain-containing protein n=1 Tax=Nocardia yunnanensis TaxID=2382165 RepID=A0A386ZDG4_9NOCA|nr:hypothetical protein [Nocardia yunnanensis]AYF74529.1 hypothetical protein D7D52_12390 [Nocardia yunnanensis]